MCRGKQILVSFKIETKRQIERNMIADNFSFDYELNWIMVGSLSNRIYFSSKAGNKNKFLSLSVHAFVCRPWNVKLDGSWNESSLTGCEWPLWFPVASKTKRKTTDSVALRSTPIETWIAFKYYCCKYFSEYLLKKIS